MLRKLKHVAAPEATQREVIRVCPELESNSIYNYHVICNTTRGSFFDATHNSTMKSKPFFLLSLTVLGVAIFSVFYPSLFHSARADQLVYLIEVADLDSFSEILNHSISFTRTRILFTGDRLYYRPLLYLVLATERFFFKYNFLAWQAVGLILHMILAAALLRLLNHIRPGRWLPLIFTLFFSLLYISADMVIWHHITMYIFCFIMILLSLSHMIRYIYDKRFSVSLWPIVFYLTLASLASEFGLIACFLIMIVLFFVKRPGPGTRYNPILLLIPIVLYAFLSLSDYLLKFPITQLLSVQSGLPKILNPVEMITHFSLVLAIGLAIPLLPGFVLFLPGERTFATLYNDGGFLNFCVQYKWIVLANSVLVIIIAAFFAFLFKYRKNIGKQLRLLLSEDHRRIPSALLITSLLLAFSYTAILVVSRGGEDFYKYLDYSLYHFYPICLFLTIAGYCLLSMVIAVDFPQRQQVKKFVIIIFCFGILLNAGRVYELNTRGRQDNQWWGQYIQQVEGFVSAHKHESDFSFNFKGHDPRERFVRIRVGEPAEKRELYGYPSEYLFRKYIDKENP